MSEVTKRPWDLVENTARAQIMGRREMEWSFQRDEEYDTDGLEGTGIVASSHSIFAYLTCDRKHAEFIHQAVNTYDAREALVRELVVALNSLRDEVSAGVSSESGYEELKPLIHHEAVMRADAVLARANEVMAPHRTDSTAGVRGV